VNEKKVKICGLFREEDIDYANEARPDYIGFVFAPGRRHINPHDAARLRRRLDDGIVPVGVFVNHRIEDIALFFRDGLIGAAQLHGEEDEGYIMRLKERCGVPLIKAVKAGAAVPEGLGSFPRGADYYLFDSGAGSGRTFDWSLLRNSPFFTLHPALPWFLAGGIGLSNITEALDTGCYGVDVSSGAETGGVKDREKIKALVKAVRGYKELL
jgi:phosphoribosylanthranilate isomerase